MQNSFFAEGDVFPVIWCIAAAGIIYVIIRATMGAVKNAPFNRLIKQSIKFGIERGGLDIKRAVKTGQGMMLRAVCPIFKPLDRYNEVEIFFLLVAYTSMLTLDLGTRQRLLREIHYYSSQGMIEPFILKIFENEMRKAGNADKNL